MKNLLILFLFTITNYIFSQAPIQAVKSIPIRFEEAEIRPEFPGGYNEFINYIGENFVAPEVEGISGEIIVNFVIEKDGKISEIKVLKDIGYNSKEEAIRVISQSPIWTPGESDGKPIRVLFQLPIKIQGY